MTKYDKITPEGTRDLLFEECEARNTIISRIRDIFEQKKFREVRTPGFEFYDVFSSNADYYPQDSMFKLIDNRGRLLTMRPDSTIPIARMTATKLKGCDLPLRLYYAQQVFRQRQELKGKNSEMMQMGLELIGLSSFESDVEILTAATEVLSACSASHFRIELGHVGIFNRLIYRLEASKRDKERIHRHIASKNYAALGDVFEGIKQDRTAEILRELPRLFGGQEVLEKARRLFSGYDDELTGMLAYLERIFRTLSELDPGDQIIMDFGLVNQAEYYSSLVFKGYVASSGDAILSGGRYDELFRDFGEDLPATGFAINVDALAEDLLNASSATDTSPGVSAGASTGTLGDSAVPLDASLGVTDASSGVSAGAFMGTLGDSAEPLDVSLGTTDNSSESPIEYRRRDDGDRSRLRIALTKGRLEEDAIEMLDKAGYDVSSLRDKGRKLLLPVSGTDMEIVFVKAADVITYVEHGVCDIGIVGKDTIAEQGGIFYEILDLAVGKCRFALAAPKSKNFYGGYGSKRIATKYPAVAGAWFESKGMDVEIIKIEGSVELAPLLGLADAIVDIVETGSTLKENGLEVIEDIRNVSARLIVNIASMKFKKDKIDELTSALERVINDGNYKG